MKKIKLLAPLLGVSTLATAVIPMVSCGTFSKEDVEELNVSIENTSIETGDYVKVEVVDKVLLDNKDVKLVLKWTDLTDMNLNYYNYYVTVQVGKTVLVQKAIDFPDGFQIKDMKTDGLSIVIPAKFISKKCDIKVSIDLEFAAYDDVAKINIFEENYLQYDGDNYDAMRSQQMPTVDGGTVLEWGINLSEWDSLDDDQDIYFAIQAHQNRFYSRTFIGMDDNNIGDVYIGQYQLETTLAGEMYDWRTGKTYYKFIQLHRPVDGSGATIPWSTAISSSEDLTGWYQFNGGELGYWLDVEIDLCQIHPEE